MAILGYINILIINRKNILGKFRRRFEEFSNNIKTRQQQQLTTTVNCFILTSEIFNITNDF